MMCKVADPGAAVRKIDDFDSEDLFVGGGLAQLTDDWWIELRSRITVREVMKGA
jgi:hypothetical protein